MSSIKLKGNPINTSGSLPAKGTKAQDFKLVKSDLSELKLSDLPFAHGRFCTAEGLNNVVTASDFREGNFGRDYGVNIIDGPLAGLHSRAVIVLDEQGVVKYTEQVPDIVQEPDYEAALQSL